LIDDQRRRAGAAVVPGDHHVIGLGLGDARRHRADADLGHQLDRDDARGLAFFRSWISCARSSIE
jgi:deoxycytidylate deaminase